MSLQFGAPHQVQDPQQPLQPQQVIQAPMRMRPVGPSNGLHPLSSDSLAPPLTSGLSDMRAGSKQEVSDAGNPDGEQ
ncbi:hypothetical protein MLD38_031531 [Melastoma candidum]|uniref:Uncharacterized protein n=1 Tax=Melastoma candidum TaxID=119954 RepID=A0ACB9MR59_9MYRT|nr:hypothetical protein MLD38_031531 [Melastoma candidum]